MNPYLEELKTLLEAKKNPDLATKMERYMRNQFQYYGVMSIERKLVLKTFLKQNGLPNKDNLEEIVQEMWQQPKREWLYCAMEIFELFLKKNKEDFLHLAEILILQHSWWDTVDVIALHIIGKTLQYFPEKTTEWTEKWANSDNIWLKRTSLIFQLMYKKDTDVNLLQKYILQHQHHKEFFIQKAIGWALRQYARTDANFVKDFVDKYHDTLPNLSKREALKHLLQNYFD